MSRDPSASPEAQAVRKERQAARRHQGGDLLEKRAKTLAFWIARDPDLHPCARASTRFPHVRTFYMNPVFWKYLMPRLRAMLEAKLREHNRAFAEELRASSARWRQAKAEKDAAKERESAPQQELLACRAPGA